MAAPEKTNPDLLARLPVDPLAREEFRALYRLERLLQGLKGVALEGKSARAAADQLGMPFLDCVQASEQLSRCVAAEVEHLDSGDGESADHQPRESRSAP